MIGEHMSPHKSRDKLCILSDLQLVQLAMPWSYCHGKDQPSTLETYLIFFLIFHQLYILYNLLQVKSRVWPGEAGVWWSQLIQSRNKAAETPFVQLHFCTLCGPIITVCPTEPLIYPKRQPSQGWLPLWSWLQPFHASLADSDDAIDLIT